jgi:Fe2+ or Zn2+ uptake regulation protein
MKFQKKQNHSPRSAIDQLSVENIYASMSQKRVVISDQVFNSLRQWFTHVSCHELEHLALKACAENQAEPNEQNKHKTTEGLVREFELAYAKKYAENVEAWPFDA